MTYAYIARVKSRAIGLAVECDRLADQVWTGEDESYLRLRADIAAGKVAIERDSLEVARGVVPGPRATSWVLRLSRWARLLRWLL
jgi:hypothetical protein